MGNRGERYSESVGEFADQVSAVLSPIGPVTWKKMFGGAGLFLEDRMFGLIDSKAQLHFKVGEANQDRYEAAGCVKHSRMPYFTVPGAVLDDADVLVDWAQASVDLDA